MRETPCIRTVGSQADEPGRAYFGDARLTARFQQVEHWARQKPATSFPNMVPDDSALEALYRFLGNERVSAQALLQPHFEGTRERARSAGEVYVLHDTTLPKYAMYDKPREGLGRLGRGEQGYLAHVSLVVEANGSKKPLGVLGLETLFRDEPPKGERDSKARREDEQRESLRWARGVEAVQGRLEEDTQAIHVMDSESDIYDLQAALRGARRRFITRACQERGAHLPAGKAEHTTVSALLPNARQVCTRQVPLSERSARRPRANLKTHPARKARLATLHVTAMPMVLRRPLAAPEQLPPTLHVNVVHVYEVNAPAGQEPVDWVLYTSEPIDTQQQVERVVDGYCTRWLIEEYFCALKTGCALEKRQVEGRTSLLNTLALYIPIAWRLLLLRSLSRTQPELNALEVFTSTQLDALRAATLERLYTKAPLAPNESLTVGQATHALARLGGHLKRNGPPGWQVLARGLNELLIFERGWCAAMALRASEELRVAQRVEASLDASPAEEASPFM